jgi:hypothetical protein
MTTGASGIKTAKQREEAERKAAAERKAREDQMRVEAARKEREKLEETYASNPGLREFEQSAAEKKAGVKPASFEGLRDIRTGELRKEFKADPFTGEASQRLKGEALGTGPSQWAKAALGRQKFEEGQLRDRGQLQAQTAQSQAQSQLARMGGLGGGARTSLARSGARDQLMAAQKAAAQGIQSRFGINEQDAQRRQELLGQTADVERAAQMANIGSMKEELGAKAEFDANRYNQQMSAWASKQSADAQRAAGRGGGKCFPEWTEIQMADDSLKSIIEIKVDDVVAGGGKVLEIRSYGDIENPHELWDYDGVDITGSHAVLEFGKWVRVQDSVYGKAMNKSVDTVYTLVTEEHLIMINGITFSDDVETDEDFPDEEISLKALNKKWGAKHSES